MPAHNAPRELGEATARMEAVIADFKRHCNVDPSWDPAFAKLQGDLFTAVLCPLHDEMRR